MLTGHGRATPLISNWPEHRLRPLVEKLGQMLIEQRVYREIFGVI